MQLQSVSYALHGVLAWTAEVLDDELVHLLRCGVQVEGRDECGAVGDMLRLVALVELDVCAGVEADELLGELVVLAVVGERLPVTQDDFEGTEAEVDDVLRAVSRRFTILECRTPSLTIDISFSQFSQRVVSSGSWLRFEDTTTYR